MKSIKSKLCTGSLVVATSFLFQFGCSSSNNPAQPDNGGKKSENENAEALSKTTVGVYENISSVGQISGFMSGADNLVELDIPELEDRSAATTFAKAVKAKSITAFKKSPDVLRLSQSTQTDSVVFDVTERDSLAGLTRRVSLLYNRADDRARFFVVEFDYSSESPLEYDSTEVTAKLNNTLFDDTDDVLTSLHTLRRFKPGQLIREEKGSFIPDEHGSSHLWPPDSLSSRSPELRACRRSWA